MNHHSLSRRTLIKGGLAVGALLPVIELFGPGSHAVAAGTELDASDPVAKALGYVSKSAKAGQECAGCVQYVGKAGEASGPCNIFPGKTVAAHGWCLSYVKKAGA